ncbi:MAG TPA: hypothetical protein VNH83_03100 [Bryobacteraceae bacterium]|nr:hypothetical protein [Bryobacteraceae bacterium]
MRLLTAFEQDVEITVKPHQKRGEAGRISFLAAAQLSDPRRLSSARQAGVRYPPTGGLNRYRVAYSGVV